MTVITSATSWRPDSNIVCVPGRTVDSLQEFPSRTLVGRPLMGVRWGAQDLIQKLPEPVGVGNPDSITQRRGGTRG
jgi:hypothetical protein